MLLFRSATRIGWRSIRSIRDRTDDYKIRKQREKFKAVVEELANLDQFTLRDYKKHVVESLQKQQSGFSRLLSGTSQEESDMVETRKVLNALTDDELMDQKLVNSDVKDEIAQVVQCTPQVVNKVMSAFRVELKLHAYLRARKLRGEHLPDTQDELGMMMNADRPPRDFEDKKSQHGKFSDKQRRFMQYRR